MTRISAVAETARVTGDRLTLTVTVNMTYVNFILPTELSIRGNLYPCSSELNVGRVRPWVGSGRVGLGHKILHLGWVGLLRVQSQIYLINIQCIHARNQLFDNYDS